MAWSMSTTIIIFVIVIAIPINCACVVKNFADFQFDEMEFPLPLLLELKTSSEL